MDLGTFDKGRKISYPKTSLSSPKTLKPDHREGYNLQIGRHG